MITVAIPSIVPRHEKLQVAIASVLIQTYPAAAISVAIDKDGDGAWKTRNRALNAVQTEWTAFLDDDDILMPHHLERLIATANDTHADLVYPWFEIRGNPDPLQREGMPFDAEVLRTGNYIPVTYLVRTELAKSVGGFPEPGSKEWPYDEAEDWGFLLKLLDAGAKFEHLNERTWIWQHWGWGTPAQPGNTSGRADRWKEAV